MSVPKPSPPADANFSAAVLRALERAVALASRPELLFELGEAYFRAKLYDHARDAFSLVSESHPWDPDTWARLGLCHFRTAMYEDALSAFAQASRLDPRYMDTHPDTAVVERKVRALLALEAAPPATWH